VVTVAADRHADPHLALVHGGPSFSGSIWGLRSLRYAYGNSIAPERIIMPFCGTQSQKDAKVVTDALPISRFPVPDLADLPEDIRTRILAVQEKSGFIPNVFLVLAHRPD
jgi:hypothetical protein